MKMIKNRLDTGYGIASISTDDPMYLENASAYWRGPVWINLNFLLLRGLNIYYES
jgi:mannosyl-oligosaccharide glucosidase